MYESVNEQEVLDILRDLVRIPTQNPPGREKACAEYVVGRLGEWEIPWELVPRPLEERPQVVSRFGPKGGPVLVLNGHLDVVPEGDSARWEYSPYEAVIRDGKLYGRGAVDMKAGIAVMLMANKILSERQPKLRGGVLCQFAIGEETAIPGTKTLLEEGYVGDWGIVMEPTHLKVVTAAKGVVWYEITVKGVPIHAGRADKGASAVAGAIPILIAVERYNRSISSRRHALVGSSMVTTTMITGGTAPNVVPESCTLRIDRRMVPSESLQQVDEEIKDMVLRHADKDPRFEYRWRRTSSYEPAEIPYDSEIARVVRKHAKRVAGVPEGPFGKPASTDQRNFVNDFHIPAIIWGPGDPTQAHTIDEHVEISQLTLATEILISVILDLLS